MELSNIEKEAMEFANRRKDLGAVYVSGLYYGFLAGSESSHDSKIEKIKAQIEVLKEVLKECEDDWVFEVLRKKEERLKELEV
jgi:hypothetical protein